MLAFEIHNDLPMPAKAPVGCVYPFRDMSVGQCAVFNLDEPTFKESRARKLVHLYHLRRGMEFTCRVDRKAGVFRVWRIK